ncbi:MAG: 2-oxoglutarate dehydrogenase complex dihydrolipoyllysine-residue succinyltransferase [Candidatus Schekmanbacteria bacterium]|nr:2-oxoglutarate dehydrogenase complex dihydrolipoyllysine-residue succinyltransferase [Candidatus Schekmanbacteria bacterium]
MTVEVRIPASGESISEVIIDTWLKHEGDRVAMDESLAMVETDKANMELPSPVAGRLVRIVKPAGAAAVVGEVIALIEAEAEVGEVAARAQAAAPPATATAADTGAAVPAREEPEPAPPRVMPAAQRLLAQHGVPAGAVAATGPGGRVLKEDVERHLANRDSPSASAPSVAGPETIAVSQPADVPVGGVSAPAAPPIPAPVPAPAATPTPAPPAAARLAPGEAQVYAAGEEVVRPMTLLRRRVAERLVQSQHAAALLTTFNEIDISGVMELRRLYQDEFQKRHGVKLGFMSFFVKAAVDALRAIPEINAEIRGTDIVYKNYYHIGVAVGGGRGLVVPVIRDADLLGFAQIERAIADLGARARDNKLKVEELQGGTFTISNGGIYGSLLSTPIINPPQSGILGMHAIQDRPVARDGQVVIRPMMYVALTYDHRLVDGREAVTFLRRIKDCVEAPSRILLEV